MEENMTVLTTEGSYCLNRNSIGDSMAYSKAYKQILNFYYTLRGRGVLSLANFDAVAAQSGDLDDVKQRYEEAVSNYNKLTILKLLMFKWYETALISASLYQTLTNPRLTTNLLHNLTEPNSNKRADEIFADFIRYGYLNTVATHKNLHQLPDSIEAQLKHLDLQRDLRSKLGQLIEESESTAERVDPVTSSKCKKQQEKISQMSFVTKQLVLSDPAALRKNRDLWNTVKRANHNIWMIKKNQYFS